MKTFRKIEILLQRKIVSRRVQTLHGEVAEWLKAHDWKSCIR